MSIQKEILEYFMQIGLREDVMNKLWMFFVNDVESDFSVSMHLMKSNILLRDLDFKDGWKLLDLEDLKFVVPVLAIHYNKKL